MHRDWDDLADQYEQAAEGRESFLGLRDLCRFIGKSTVSGALFGHTSMNTLAISQVAVSYPPHHSVAWLRIEPLDDKLVEFRFEDTMRPERQWRRTVRGADAIARFNRTVEQLGWSASPLL